MTDIPIIFSGPMVRALLEGHKTMTRRLPAGVWEKLHTEFNYRPIASYSDYLAGRDGVIYSLKGGGFMPLAASPTSKGYTSVSLCGKDGIKTFHVHRLVADSWLGPRPSPIHEVRHLNSKRDDARLVNIDWATASENWADRAALENGIHENHHSAKLNFDLVEDIRASSLPQRALAEKYGVAQSTINAIRLHKVWVKAPPSAGRNFSLPPPPRLWVRENLRRISVGPGNTRGINYVADGDMGPVAMFTPDDPGKLKAIGITPCIHMPRWASRLTLVVTASKVERLQDITEHEAIDEGATQKETGLNQYRSPNDSWSMDWPEVEPAEGWKNVALGSARMAFGNFINRLHGGQNWNLKRSDLWTENPDVIALTFTVHKVNIDQMEATI